MQVAHFSCVPENILAALLVDLVWSQDMLAILNSKPQLWLIWKCFYNKQLRISDLETNRAESGGGNTELTNSGAFSADFAAAKQEICS